MWISPLLICCVNKAEHHQLQGVFTYLTLSKIISRHLMPALCHTKCFLCGGGGLLTSIEDLIKEITAHNLRVFIEGQCH